jgi:hypothetical protein
MTRGTGLLRIFGFLALLLFASGQFLRAGEVLWECAPVAECEDHSPGTQHECPVEQSCCHVHLNVMVVSEVVAIVPVAACHDGHFSASDLLGPEGCLREIDYPPQLS